MTISARGRYALRLMIDLAQHAEAGWVSLKEISARQDISAKYLEQIVPILNKIPLVSFFFDRKGNYISNRKLLILLKANIVIPAEHEPTPAQVSPASKASRL